MKGEYARMVTAAKENYMKRLGAEVSNPALAKRNIGQRLKN
jgi:hypothetical protein